LVGITLFSIFEVQTKTNEMDRIKLVVFKGHTLGYILPELPTSVQVLHASILKGAPCNDLYPSSKQINSTDEIKLATEQDFHSFRVSFQGYDKLTEIYEYDNSSTIHEGVEV